MVLERSFDQWVYRTDFYEMEVRKFEWDLHILIIGTLEDGVKGLAERVAKDSAYLESKIEKAEGYYAEHLADQHAEIWMQGSGQERFLRSMALVALTSRLIHTLRQISMLAEHFRPLTKHWQNRRLSEFQRIWNDAAERFGIDFSVHQDKIAFTDVIREVRNQIVHDAGEANPYKTLESARISQDFSPTLDRRFSQKYPDYVDGEDSMAEVSVNQAQLDAHFEASLALVKWFASELRSRELIWLREASGHCG